MINIDCRFRAKSLYIPANIKVLLPPFFDHGRTKETLGDVYKDGNVSFKTLLLLHGAFNDAHSWHGYTNIEKYAHKHRLAVVMPTVGNSFGANMVHGLDYWTFLSDELIRFVRSIFPLSEKREDNYVAGLSMGGYEAFKLALNLPETFSAAISLSGVLDIVSAFRKSPEERLFDVKDYFGSVEALQGSDSDLFALLAKLKKNGRRIPRLYAACGTEDSLFDSNQRFLEVARDLSVDVTYEEGPGGHDWDFWDAYIERGLDWLCQ